MDPAKKSKKKGLKRNVSPLKDDANKKKRYKEAMAPFIYTEVQFLYDLKHNAHPNTAFVKFWRHVQGSGACDVVDKYCKSEPGFKQIFDILEKAKDPEEKTEVLAVFVHFLMRIAQDHKEKHLEVGKSVGRRLIKDHLSDIARYVSNEHHLTTVMFSLLVAIVSLGRDMAKEAFNCVDLSHRVWIKAVDQRSQTGELDIRTCLILFITSLLVAGDGWLIKEMLERKAVIQAIFSGLMQDRSDVIKCFLSALLFKVVKNNEISKTVKAKLFAGRVAGIGKLYRWEEPKHEDEPESRRKLMEVINWGISTEKDGTPRERVRSITHMFLRTLFCSTKDGIIYHDTQFGATKLNKNNVALSLLQSLEKYWLDELACKLVVQMLRLCPDILHIHLNKLAKPMAPGPTAIDRAVITEVVREIYEHQPPVSPAFTQNTLAPPSELCAMAINTLLPPEAMLETLIKAIKDSSETLLQYKALQLLTKVCSRINASLEEYIKRNPNNSQAFIRPFLESIKLVHMRLPMLMKIHDELLDSIALSGVHRKKFLTAKKGVKPKQSSQVKSANIESAILLKSLYQLLIEHQKLDYHFVNREALNFVAILSGLQQCDEALGNSCQLQQLQSLALQLVANQTTERSVGDILKQKEGGETFLHLVLDMAIPDSDDTKLTQCIHDLIVQMLMKTGVFGEQTEELKIWLATLSAIDIENEDTLIQFLETAILRMIKESWKYTQDVDELLARAAELTHAESQHDFSLQDVLAMPEVAMEITEDVESSASKSSEGDVSDKAQFSGLLIAACTVLNETKDRTEEKSDLEELQLYLQNVVCGLIRAQTDALPLCLLVLQHRDHIFTEKLISKIKPHLPKDMRKEITETDLEWDSEEDDILAADSSLVRYLEDVFEGDKTFDTDDSELINELIGADLEPDAWPCVIRQIMMYVKTEACVQKTDKQKLRAYFEIIRVLMKELSEQALKETALEKEDDKSMVDDVNKTAQLSEQESDKSIIPNVDKTEPMEKSGEKEENEQEEATKAEIKQETVDETDVVANVLKTNYSKTERSKTEQLSNLIEKLKKDVEVKLDINVESKQIKEKYLNQCIRVLLEHPFMCHMFLWQPNSPKADLKYKMKNKASVSTVLTQGLSDVIKMLVTYPAQFSAEVESVINQYVAKIKDVTSIENCAETPESKEARSVYAAIAAFESFMGSDTRALSVQVLVKKPEDELINEGVATESGELMIKLLKGLLDVSVDYHRTVEFNKTSAARLLELGLNCEEIENVLCDLIPLLPKAFVGQITQPLCMKLIESKKSYKLAVVAITLSSQCKKWFEEWLKEKKFHKKAPKTKHLGLLQVLLGSQDKDSRSDAAKKLQGDVMKWVVAALTDSKSEVDERRVSYAKDIMSVFLETSHKTELMSYVEKQDLLKEVLKEEPKIDHVIPHRLEFLHCLMKNMKKSNASETLNGVNPKNAKIDNLLIPYLVQTFKQALVLREEQESSSKAVQKCCFEIFSNLFTSEITCVLDDESKTHLENMLTWPDMTGVALESEMGARLLTFLKQAIIVLYNKDYEEQQAKQNAEVAKEAAKPEKKKMKKEEKSRKKEETASQNDGSKMQEDHKSGQHTLFDQSEEHTQENKMEEEEEMEQDGGDDVTMASESSSSDSESESSEEESNSNNSNNLVCAGPGNANVSNNNNGHVVVPNDGESNKKAVLKGVFDGLMNQPKFEEIMQLEKQGSSERVALLNLMFTVTKYESGVCESEHVALLFSAYTASLCEDDILILAILRLYEQNGVNFHKYRPYIWGEAAREHYASQEEEHGRSLSRQTNVYLVLDVLDAELVMRSAINFPLKRKLQLDLSTPDLAVDCAEVKDIHDPCFLLPLFSYLLLSEHNVNCKKFVSQNCMAYLMCALSSHDNEMRALAYTALARFHYHAEAARFRENTQLLYMICFVRNSITEPNMRLPCIISVFLAKCCSLLLDPLDKMWGIMNKFLLVKPSLDLNVVPEFYKLFNSSSPHYKKERGWMLELLKDGLREDKDWVIYEKRYALKLLLGLHDSALSDLNTQLQVLKIIQKAFSMPTIAKGLLTKHAPLAWLHQLVLSPSLETKLSAVLGVLSALWFTLKDVLPSLEKRAVNFTELVAHDYLNIMRVLVSSVKSFENPSDMASMSKLYTSVIAQNMNIAKVSISDEIGGGVQDAPSARASTPSGVHESHDMLHVLLHWGNLPQTSQHCQNFRNLALKMLHLSDNLMNNKESVSFTEANQRTNQDMEQNCLIRKSIVDALNSTYDLVKSAIVGIHMVAMLKKPNISNQIDILTHALCIQWASQMTIYLKRIPMNKGESNRFLAAQSTAAARSDEYMFDK